jgi:phage recombination protein Bet
MSTQLSVISQMAARYEMDPKEFESTIKKTVFPSNGTQEQFMSFLLVAKEYNLNPMLKEIYAFPGKNGGIVPVVGIDGWLNITNSHPQFDGMEFKDVLSNDGKISAITCKIYRKDRKYPTEVTEYLAECIGATDPWKRWPCRMLRHKATVQASRYAFGFSGIVDEDEAQRLNYPEAINVNNKPSASPTPSLAAAIESKKQVANNITITDPDTGEVLTIADEIRTLVLDNMDAIKNSIGTDKFTALEKSIANNFDGWDETKLTDTRDYLTKINN